MRNVFYCENKFYEIEISRKKFVYFHLKKSLDYFSHKHMRKVSLVLVETKHNNNVNNNMMLISDNVDNAEAHHSLGKSKKVNLNLNFAYKK